MKTYECLIEIIEKYWRLKAALLTEPKSHDTADTERCFHYAQFAQGCAGIIERYLEEFE